MLKNLSYTQKQALLIAVVCCALLGLYLTLGPPHLLAKSESPDFCASCHVMEAQHTAFMHAGAHRRFKCVDCHLPNDNLASHYIWKSIDGMKDVLFFYSGKVPEKITLSEHGAKVVKANCIRCHETLVSQMDTSRNCWSCHRRVTHTGTGALQTNPLLQTNP
ncbi:cytochrome c nitrite reductase small subunit [Trichlorobacter lovleyi]|uniref:Cytochrome c nitrate reductase, small subunit n=1 Tax=Trichlorobacter lovleyi (strain ATCC BAA-1151 / DSM 17278 / SZ) TaxID=398767 RepID=B3E642_TRIL1|nr:cytochrome c nitrite reductase small subunit [Trichlorobacter lovleyi]ACD94766.1 cytochrome c nitrate reductase, small subunit [Trichlorobacter lovleyi SZ]